MKAFLAALLAIAVITVGADLGLHHLAYSSADMYRTGDVRLGDQGMGWPD